MSSKNKDKGKDKQSKNLKKLNNFFDKNASLSKRFKSLISYIGKKEHRATTNLRRILPLNAFHNNRACVTRRAQQILQ